MLAAILLVVVQAGVQAGADRPTQFTNTDSIVNTRHNLTQSTMQNGQGSQMNNSRNDEGEVCVYCHTPHGVPVSGNSGPLIPSSLRVSNNGSAVCLTCHIK